MAAAARREREEDGDADREERAADGEDEEAVDHEDRLEVLELRRCIIVDDVVLPPTDEPPRPPQPRRQLAERLRLAGGDVRPAPRQLHAVKRGLAGRWQGCGVAHQPPKKKTAADAIASITMPNARTTMFRATQWVVNAFEASSKVQFDAVEGQAGVSEQQFWTIGLISA